MRLEVGAVDHQGPGSGAIGGQDLEDAVEDPGDAPAYESVVEGLVGSVAGGRIAPHQTVADDMDDAADDLSVIDPRDAPYLVG